MGLKLKLLTYSSLLTLFLSGCDAAPFASSKHGSRKI